MVRVWRMQLCFHRYVRITGLLNTPLVNLRIWDWLCILPTITLVVDKSKKVNKAASSDWWTAKPTRWKAFQIAFPLGRGERLLYIILVWSELEHLHSCFWYSCHSNLKLQYFVKILVQRVIIKNIKINHKNSNNSIIKNKSANCDRSTFRWITCPYLI